MANKTARLGNAASDVVVAKVAVSGAIRSTASASLPPIYPTPATLRILLTTTHAVFITAWAHDDDVEANTRPGRRSLRRNQGRHRLRSTGRKGVPQQRWV